MSLAASAGRGLGAVWSPTHVQVTVLQARGLRAKGPGGTSDAYAVIQVGKEKYATSVSERSLGAPVWREEATFELPPLLSGGAAAAAATTLQLTVLHRALLGLDKFLGRAEVDLRELHRDQGRRKTQWFTLKSKPGKKEKDRGEIEVDIQFMRNNMTASMFDLSMKDKSRNPFGKLKDKIKGKNKDSASDTASAIVPSSLPSIDSDDESSLKDKKKKSKIKTLFSKSTLQKTPLSQSMSVLPTSKSDKVLLRPGGFQSRWGDDDDEDNEGESSSAASDAVPHKRTASADPKQLSQLNFTLPKKDGLSFLSGLRSKNDFLSRSNVCINGNHVYMEQPEAKTEARDSSPSSSPSPQSSRKKHLFSSTENLTAPSCKESGEGGAMSSDKWLSDSPTTDMLKSMSLPPSWPPVANDTGEHPTPSHLETGGEAKETKKQEGKKSSLLSLVTGKKDVARVSEGDSPPATSRKEKETRPKEDGPWPAETLVKRAEKDTTAAVSGKGPSLNPFEEVHSTHSPEMEAGPEPKPEPTPPVPMARTLQTKAVKPRPEVSPEPPPAAMPSSPDPALCLPALDSTAVPSEPETPCPESPLACAPLSSPLTAPVSTSTPIEHWPPASQGQLPSLPLLAEVQQEGPIHAPDPVSRTWGSLSQEPLGAERDGREVFLTSETRQTDSDKNVSCGDSEGPLLQRQEQGAPCQGWHSHSPYLGKAQEALWLGGDHPDVEKQPKAFVNRVGADGTVLKEGQEGPPPLPPGDAATDEPPVGVSEGRRKTKKRVSFSEPLFTEAEAELLPGPDSEGPQERTQEGSAAGHLPGEQPAEWLPMPEPDREKTGPVVGTPRPHSYEEGPSEGARSGEPSSEKDSPLLSTEGEDALLAHSQSKASDHEGALSDPLGELQSRVTVGLDLSLPSIPEVASDDERVDPSEGDGDAAKGVPWGVGAPFPGRAPASPEEGAGPGGRAGELAVAAGSPHNLSLKAPGPSVTASPSRPTALGMHEAGPGTCSGPDRQGLSPGCGEEAEGLGSGRLGQSLGGAPDSPVTSTASSDTFPTTHSGPNSPHSDAPRLSTAESQTKAAAEGKVEHSSKRKPLLQAWVSPSEARPASAAPSTGSGVAKHRPHPVKPMNSTAAKVTNSSLGTATIISENLINEVMMKKYNPSDPAFAYAQLTHDELIQLVLKQKEAISKKEFQVRELEDYIDNLLVRVMEETPNILRVPAQVGKKAGKM